MKIINDFLEKYGADKFLHLLVASNIILLGSLFGLCGFIIAWLILIPLMFLKEFLDEQFDWYDILWGAYGGIMSSIAFISLLLFQR